jgi:gluconokinase
MHDPKSLYVVMGVAGSGKTLIGRMLANALGVEFVEGDDYHPRENVERMKAGIPLTDENRAGWLQALAQRLREAREKGTGLVVSCSALKRAYRDVLRSGAPHVRFVFLRGSRETIAARLTRRRGHFMPASLLDSQFATLEEPAPDEDVWVFDTGNSPPRRIVDGIVARASGASGASGASA